MHDDYISKRNYKKDSKNPISLDLTLLTLPRPRAHPKNLNIPTMPNPMVLPGPDASNYKFHAIQIDPQS